MDTAVAQPVAPPDPLLALELAMALELATELALTALAPPAEIDELALEALVPPPTEVEELASGTLVPPPIDMADEASIDKEDLPQASIPLAPSTIQSPVSVRAQARPRDSHMRAATRSTRDVPSIRTCDDPISSPLSAVAKVAGMESRAVDVRVELVEETLETVRRRIEARFRRRDGDVGREEVKSLGSPNTGARV